MPNICYEDLESREVVMSWPPSARTKWHVLGPASHGDAITLLRLTAPVQFQVNREEGYGGDPADNIYLHRLTVSVRELDSGTPGAGPGLVVRPGVWEGSVEYDYQPKKLTDFDTGGHTLHITNSRNTRGKFSYRDTTPGQGLAPNFAGSIGVTDRDVEGVDKVIGAIEFSEKWIFADEDMTDAYKAILMQTTGCVNDSGFRGWSRGEVLFMGASARQRSDGFLNWDVVFKFAVQENITSAAPITIGGIPGITKEGWNYLWVRYEETTSTVEVPSGAPIKVTVKVPRYVYVEEIYSYASFGLLNLV